MLLEDAFDFAQDLAAAGIDSGNPGKEGGRAIKQAFNDHADHAWLATLDTVHWTWDLYGMIDLIGKRKDELSANMVLPSEDFPPESGEYGLWIKGRITLATNDMDKLYSGHYEDYGPGKEGTEEEVAHRDRSSGRNKRPTVSQDYSRYANLKRKDGMAEKVAKRLPYILDETMWNPDDWRGNEALVDNWRPVGIVVTYDDQAYALQSLSDLQTEEDIREFAVGNTKMILLAALEAGLPIYDLQKDELWSPE